MKPEDADFLWLGKETPTRVTHACAECGGFIDGDEVKVRSYDEGWLPYHPICAPEPGLAGEVIFIRGGC